MEDQSNSEGGGGITRYNIYQLTTTPLLVTTQCTVG